MNPTRTDAAANTAIRALAQLESLALEKGLDDVSMRDVAKRVGVSLAALQYHYPTKTALLDAFVQHSIETYRNRLGTISSAHGDAARYAHVVRFIAIETRRIAEGGVLAMIEARAVHDPAAKRAMSAFMQAYLSTLDQVIADAFPDLTPSQTRHAAALICSLLEGLASTQDAARAFGADDAHLVEAAIQTASLIPKVVARIGAG
ncbi:MAG: TetR family transcriptional regulator [Alphaproteobacteria bacterium]|nr:TetR family transcriptional regulator [Alphaproteobacteria bacterium]